MAENTDDLSWLCEKSEDYDCTECEQFDECQELDIPDFDTDVPEADDFNSEDEDSIL